MKWRRWATLKEFGLSSELNRKRATPWRLRKHDYWDLWAQCSQRFPGFRAPLELIPNLQTTF
jgi:hypothetical protein